MNVIDMHCDTIGVINNMKRAGKNISLRENNLHIDLMKLKNSGYMLQNFAAFVPMKKKRIDGSVIDPYIEAVEIIETFDEEIDINQDIVAHVYKFEDINENQANGKISAMLTLEEGGMCKGNIDKLITLYNMGARMMTLTWNYKNELGYPNVNMDEVEYGSMHDQVLDIVYKANTNDGLTNLGIEFVREMQDIGMIVDVSHLSDAGFYDVAKNTKLPFVASHSNSRSVCPWTRNLTDDMIEVLAKKGGVTGLNFCMDFLVNTAGGEPKIDYIDAVVKHAKHIVNIGGIDCLGIGTDFDGIAGNDDIPDAGVIPMICERMAKAGFANDDIEKIMFRNVLRVYKECLK